MFGSAADYACKLWGAMKTRFLIGSGKSVLIKAACGCFGLFLFALVPFSALAAATTEPVDIAALRASQARSATELRQQAIKLRCTVKGPKTSCLVRFGFGRIRK